MSLIVPPSPKTFKNPKPALAQALAETGSMENGIKKKGVDDSAKKKKRVQQGGVSALHLGTSLGIPIVLTDCRGLTWKS